MCLVTRNFDKFDSSFVAKSPITIYLFKNNVMPSQEKKKVFYKNKVTNYLKMLELTTKKSHKLMTIMHEQTLTLFFEH